MESVLKKSAFVLMSGLLLVGCSSNDNVFDEGASAVADNPLGFSVADNFDWNTLQKVQVTVKTDGDYSKYGVSLYDENPAGNPNANLLAQGTAATSFSANVEVGKGQKYIYAQELTPDGAKLVRCAALSGTSASIDFSAKAAAKSQMRKLSSKLSGVTWPSAPAESDYKTTVPAGTPSFSNYKDDGTATSTVYYVDNSIKSISAGKAENLTLYITGNNVSLNYTNGNSASKWTIYILPDASLNITNSIDFINTKIYIAKGGKLSGGSISAGHTASAIYNNGTISATSLQTNNDGLIYNQGTISVPDGDVSVENDASTIVNDGTITAKTVNAAGSGNIANSGVVTVTDATNLSSNNNIWENEGKWTTKTMKLDGGSTYLINSCKLTVTGDMSINFGTGTFTNNAGSSIIIDGNLDVTNCNLNLLSNSIIKVAGTTTFNATNVITGAGNASALLLQKTLTSGWRSATFDGNLVVAYDDITSVNDQYNTYTILNSPATMVNSTGNAGVHIAKNGECSDGYNPIPVIIDPSTYSTVSFSHIYAMEDNWPDYGDYDLNDIVAKVDVKAVSEQTAAPTSSSDKIFKKLVITPTFMAKGAENNLGAYLQFDKIKSSEVTSNNVEANQTYAVVPLAKDLTTLMGGKYINVGEASKRSADNYKKGTETTINLSTAVSQEDIENGLNFFVTVNGNDKGRKEIHLGGFRATDLAGSFTGKYISGANIYKATSTNLVWGVCLPGDAAYIWPVEKTSIKDVNTSFVNWCTSNGAEDTNWYNQQPAK